MEEVCGEMRIESKKQIEEKWKRKLVGRSDRSKSIMNITKGKNKNKRAENKARGVQRSKEI